MKRILLFKNQMVWMLILALFIPILFPFSVRANDRNVSQKRDSAVEGVDIPSFGRSREEINEFADRPTDGRMDSGEFGTSVFYNVHILGEVAFPGSFRILPSDRLSDALIRAGGPLPQGSQRYIQLRRQGVTRVIDYYAYKIKGELYQNPYLMENDVVFVPLKKGEIQVEGPVKRPGFYEINNPVSLAHAISMAGGFATGRSVKEPVRVIRYGADESKLVLTVENTEEDLKHFVIKKGDIVVVPHVLIAKKTFDYNVQRLPGDNIFYPTLNDSVYVVGAVQAPGPYPFQPNYSFKEYVSQAGLSDGGAVRRAKIIKSDGKKLLARNIKEINAGDTIVVPGKAITSNKVIQWFNTLSNAALTTFVFYDRFAN